MPLTKADECSPFKLQLISLLKKFDPDDKINVSEIVFQKHLFYHQDQIFLKMKLIVI